MDFSKRKFTRDNLARLIITLVLMIVTLIVATIHSIDKSFIFLHIFFGIGSIVLLIKVIYMYLKGE